MTNVELFNKFIEIDSAQLNIFDRRCALKKLESEYATTEFALAFPECNVIEAYTLFYDDITNLGTLLRNFKDKDLPKMLEDLTAKLDFSSVLQNMDPSTLDFLKAITPNVDFN